MRGLLPVMVFAVGFGPVPAMAIPDVPDRPGREMLPAASSDDHLWYTVERSEPTPGVELRHAARSMEKSQYSRAMPLSGRPVALAAWGQQLWLIYPSTGAERGRDVFTVQVERNVALEGWFMRPPDRLKAATSLRPPGELVGFAGTAVGPVALLRPEPPVRRGAAADAPGPTLMQLRGREWVRVDLPPDLPAGARVEGLGVTGDNGQRLILFADSRDRGRTAVYRHDHETGHWSGPTELDRPPSALLGTTRVHDNLALVMLGAAGTPGRHALSGGVPDELILAYLRPTTVLPLGSIERPAGRWAVLGLRDRIYVIEQTPSGTIQAATIDPLNGETGPFVTMTRQPLMAGRLLHRPLLFALAITALMLVFLFRPNSGAAETVLPSTLVVLPLMARAVALAVDLGVGAAVAVLLLRCDPAELLQLPLWTTDLAASTPYLVMAGVTMLHSGAMEFATRKSLGKNLVGARVTALDGSRPGLRPVLIRNLFKALVLLIPVLAVFALLTPHLQGLGDSMARTLVVRDAVPAEKDESNGR